jgi:hypothetical protein
MFAGINDNISLTMRPQERCRCLPVLLVVAEACAVGRAVADRLRM